MTRAYCVVIGVMSASDADVKDKESYARWNSTEGLTCGDPIAECNNGEYGCEPAWDAGVIDGEVTNQLRAGRGFRGTLGGPHRLQRQDGR